MYASKTGCTENEVSKGTNLGKHLSQIFCCITSAESIVVVISVTFTSSSGRCNLYLHGQVGQEGMCYGVQTSLKQAVNVEGTVH